MATSTPKSYQIDPALYLYTSLTSGSSHIVTATSRLETILKANRIPFKALDIATDEKARMLWGRRSGKDETGRARKIPGLVQMGLVVGDLVEIEDWNEYGELKQHVTIVNGPGAPVKSAVPTPSSTPSKAPVGKENQKPASMATPDPEKPAEPAKALAGGAPTSITLAMRQAGEEAAQKAKDNKTKAPVETFAGVGKAGPAKETEKAVSKPAHIDVSQANKYDHKINTVSSFQSPTTTAWRPAPGSSFPTTTPRNSIDRVESVQSPNSTAWRPKDVDQPITMHGGSSVSQASAECIKKIEDEETILEEDEEDEEDEGEEEEEEDEEDEEDSDEEEDSDDD